MKFESQLRLRGYWGENKIVQFSDGAIDVYISGAVLTFCIVIRNRDNIKIHP